MSKDERLNLQKTKNLVQTSAQIYEVFASFSLSSEFFTLFVGRAGSQVQLSPHELSLGFAYLCVLIDRKTITSKSSLINAKAL